jgi:hypothetical protein
MPIPPKPLPPVPTDAQRVTDAIARVKERGALKQDTCPQCSTFDWDVDFLAIPTLPLRAALNVPADIKMHIAVGFNQGYFPALVLACKNCGNTLKE